MSRLDDQSVDERWHRALTGTAFTVDVAGASGRVAARVSRRHRRHRAGVVLAVAITIVVVVGTLSALNGRDSSRAVRAGNGGAQSEPVVAVVHVASLPSLSLSVDRTVVPPGVIEIDYANGGGTHVLRIGHVPHFRLAVPQGPTVGRVRLGPGRYELYCDIPGHIAAGEHAVLTVRRPGEKPGG